MGILLAFGYVANSNDPIFRNIGSLLIGSASPAPILDLATDVGGGGGGQ